MCLGEAKVGMESDNWRELTVQQQKTDDDDDDDADD